MVYFTIIITCRKCESAFATGPLPLHNEGVLISKLIPVLRVTACWICSRDLLFSNVTPIACTDLGCTVSVVIQLVIGYNYSLVKNCMFSLLL